MVKPTFFVFCRALCVLLPHLFLVIIYGSGLVDPKTPDSPDHSLSLIALGTLS